MNALQTRPASVHADAAIPYGRQEVTDEDVRAVLDVLYSDWLTQGPAIERFERTVADWCGAAHAIAVSNATAALHLACRALGLGPGGRLWTSPNTFVASANCARYCGADVDFVDIDPGTWNMDAGALANKLARAELEGTLPDVVVPVHFAGQSCDMRAIQTLGRRYGFRIIEDASHAIGGSYLDGRVGSGRWSDLTVFSFHPVKIVTSGEGGMVLTNDPELAERVALLRSHGVTRDPVRLARPEEGAWYYEQVDLGYNYRITDLQAALGASQMARLAQYVERRHVLKRRYDELLDGLPLVLPSADADTVPSWHLYVVLVDTRYTGRSRREVFDALRARGIGVNVHYIPVHLQPDYRRLGFRPGDFPVAEAYYEHALTLPLFPAMTEAEQDRVVSYLKEVLC